MTKQSERKWRAHMKIGELQEKKRVEAEWEKWMSQKAQEDRKRVEMAWEEHMKNKRPTFKRELTKIAKDIISKKKQKIVEEHGTEPTICYFFYLWNAVDYVGEVDLRKSFESIKGQGDEIIVGDYSSTDKTAEIAREYGFKVVNVEKEEGIVLAQSKIQNKIIKESKCNFMVEMDVHVEYPKNINNIIVEWLRNNDIRKKMLVLRGLWVNEQGELQREYSFGPAPVFYRHYFVEARGYDERTYMSYGGTHYGVALMQGVYGLEFDDKHVDNMIHKFHIPQKVKTLNDLFKVSDINESHVPATSFAISLIDKLRRNFEKGVRGVRNSYW